MKITEGFNLPNYHNDETGADYPNAYAVGLQCIVLFGKDERILSLAVYDSQGAYLAGKKPVGNMTLTLKDDEKRELKVSRQVKKQSYAEAAEIIRAEHGIEVEVI